MTLLVCSRSRWTVLEQTRRFKDLSETRKSMRFRDAAVSSSTSGREIR